MLRVFVVCIVLTLGLPIAASGDVSAQGKTLLLGAVPQEIIAFQEALENSKPGRLGAIRYEEGTLFGLPVVLALTGAGKANTGMVLGYLVGKFEPRQIVLSGTAARVKPSIKAGDVFIVTESLFHDWGNLTADGMVVDTPIWGPGEGVVTRMPLRPDEDLLETAIRAASSYRPAKKIEVDGRAYLSTVHTAGRVATGDLFSVNEWKMNEVRDKYGADLLEMETASLGLVAQHMGIPWIAFRAGSDLVRAGDASEEYLKYGPIAAREAAQFTLHFLETLAQGDP